MTNVSGSNEVRDSRRLLSNKMPNIKKKNRERAISPVENRGFSLIELLVVFAIIGLLAAVTLVALKEVIEKARLARGRNFTAQIHHALGAYAVGIWDFDEGEGSEKVYDSSGCGNDGIIVGATFKCGKDDTLSGQGCSLYFSGEGDYVQVPDDDSLDITDEITVVAWVYLFEQGGDYNYPGIVCKHGAFLLRYCLPQEAGETSNHFEAFVYIKDTPEPRVTNGPYTDYDKWYYVAMTYDKDEVGDNLRIYVNGRLEGQDRGDGPINISEGLAGDLYFGKFGLETDVSYFEGLIDEVRIYRQVLSSSQIKKLYVEEVRKKKLILSINDY